MSTYRMNRAVGVFNKGDVFTSDPDHPMIESLLGAGYAELVYEPGKPKRGEDDADTLRGESGDDPDGTATAGP